MQRGSRFFRNLNLKSPLKKVFMIFGFLFLILLLVGCKSKDNAELPVRLSFNVTDVFYKTIDGDPYAVLFFDVSNLDKHLSVDVASNDDIIYVLLYEQNSYAKPFSFTKEKPVGGIFIKGRVIYVYPNTISVSYAFDTIRIPKITSKEPNQIKTARALIYSNGTAQIESLVYS